MSSFNPIEIAKSLSGADFPASKGHLLETATANEAEDKILEQLRGIEDREYDGPDAVNEALTKV